MNKRILSVFLIFISVSLFSQNINDILPKFNKKGMETDILYNPAGVVNIEKINDKKQNCSYTIFIKCINRYHFLTLSRDTMN